MTIAVKTVFNTDVDGKKHSGVDPYDVLSIVYHGPFSSLDRAQCWAEDFLLESFDAHEIEEVFVGDIEIPKSELNDPEALWTIGANTRRERYRNR